MPVAATASAAIREIEPRFAVLHVGNQASIGAFLARYRARRKPAAR